MELANFMASIVGRGGGIQSPPATSQAQEKKIRNKRKFRADPPLIDPSILFPGHIECPGYDFSIGSNPNNPSPEQPHNPITKNDNDRGCECCVNQQNDVGLFKFDPWSSRNSGTSSSVDPKPDQSKPVSESVSDKFHDANWGALTETELEELVLSNLDTIFRTAIKKITSFGYSEEVSLKAVLRSGLCYGCKDTVSNIVDNTLAFLCSGQDLDSSRKGFFTDLKLLEQYILAEMVCVLREVRPSFSMGDAMWRLLICDMNVSHACAMDDGDLLVGDLNASFPVPDAAQLKPKDGAAKPNNPNLGNGNDGVVSQGPQEENPTVATEECLPTIPQWFSPVDKPLSCSKKVGHHSNSSKRESILRQKSHLEKNYHAYGSRGFIKTAKLSSLSGLVIDKKSKSISDANSTNIKSASLKLSKAVDMALTDGKQNLTFTAGTSTSKTASGSGNGNSSKSTSNNNNCTADTELSLSTPAKLCTAPKTTSCDVNNVSNADGSDGGIMPRDWVIGDEKKDELLMKLVSHTRELQVQLNQWNEWAQQKVMQAARRLSKDKAELQLLRQDKEEVVRLKKEKQTLEENTMKKLSEMESALSKATGQVERANATVKKLEVENAELREQMEQAKVKAAQSAARCQEALDWENKSVKKFLSWDKQKAEIQEDLAVERQKHSQLQQQLEQAKEYLNQLEAKWKQEEKVKDEVLMQAKSERKGREQIEAAAKLEEDRTRLKAESGMHEYRKDILRLENQISRLRLKANSSKISSLRWGADPNYASCVVSAKENSASYILGMADLQEPDAGVLLRERECVMCLTEEMSVLFLPCAHQVVCTKCNELHEKQGIKDCPSCRGLIQQRIRVRYADS
ncbi:hypothetical protein QJS10_CPA05g00574 [Acorus calamus]|uniref:RING-type domain-containing protein n=1 Tax=Acorus calamus TaxID=4465 RepID=A0AAV9EXP0_ACOCL|nr:hypothetical protein QJS10_CPA05g00574 [Acorus calamus]